MCVCTRSYLCVCVRVLVSVCDVNFVSYLGKDLFVLDDVLVGGEQHVELAAAQLRYKGPPGSGRALQTHKRGVDERL